VLKKIRTFTLHHLHAWESGDSLSAECLSPPPSSLEANFDVAIRPNFVVVVATFRDYDGNFLAMCSKKLPSLDANLGEAHAAMLATSLAVSLGCASLILEGDSLLTIL
jgi:hypothetical protein